MHTYWVEYGDVGLKIKSDLCYDCFCSKYLYELSFIGVFEFNCREM